MQRLPRLPVYVLLVFAILNCLVGSAQSEIMFDNGVFIVENITSKIGVPLRLPIKYVEYRSIGGSVYIVTGNMSASGGLTVSDTCSGSLTIISKLANMTANCVLGTTLMVTITLGLINTSWEEVANTVASLTGVIIPPFTIDKTVVVGNKVLLTVRPSGGARFIVEVLNKTTLRVIWDTSVSSWLFNALKWLPAKKIVYNGSTLAFTVPEGATAETVYRLASSGYRIVVPVGHGGAMPATCTSNDWCLLYSVFPTSTSSPTTFGLIVFRKPGAIYYSNGRLEVYGEVMVSGKLYETGIYGIGASNVTTITVTVPQPPEPQPPQLGLPDWYWFVLGFVVLVNALALLLQMKPLLSRRKRL